MRPMLALLLTVLLTASCSQLLDSGQAAGKMEVRAAPPNLVLTNTGDESIHYLVFEADVAARALWGPCTNPAQAECPPLKPGQKRTLPLRDIYGYEAGKGQRVIVYWWHLVPDGQGRWRVDGMQSAQVEVP